MLISAKIAKTINQEIKGLETLLKTVKAHEEQYSTDHSNEKKEIEASINFYKKMLVEGQAK